MLQGVPEDRQDQAVQAIRFHLLVQLVQCLQFCPLVPLLQEHQVFPQCLVYLCDQEVR